MADGNGKSIKPFKMEWATRKDGELIVGSVGKEWVTQEKGFIHNDAEWIKVLTGMDNASVRGKRVDRAASWYIDSFATVL